MESRCGPTLLREPPVGGFPSTRDSESTTFHASSGPAGPWTIVDAGSETGFSWPPAGRRSRSCTCCEFPSLCGPREGKSARKRKASGNRSPRNPPRRRAPMRYNDTKGTNANKHGTRRPHGGERATLIKNDSTHSESSEAGRNRGPIRPSWSTGSCACRTGGATMVESSAVGRSPKMPARFETEAPPARESPREAARRRESRTSRRAGAPLRGSASRPQQGMTHFKLSRFSARFAAPGSGRSKRRVVSAVAPGRTEPAASSAVRPARRSRVACMKALPGSSPEGASARRCSAPARPTSRRRFPDSGGPDRRPCAAAGPPRPGPSWRDFFLSLGSRPRPFPKSAPACDRSPFVRANRPCPI